MQNITPMMKSPYELMIFLLCLELFNKNGEHWITFLYVFLFVSPTICILMILGVLCNVAISIDCSWLFLDCSKIFDLGILWIICRETSFLMIITSEPSNVMSTHMNRIKLSFLKLKYKASSVSLSKFRGQADTLDSPVIVLQANLELYTSDRGEIRVY